MTSKAPIIAARLNLARLIFIFLTIVPNFLNNKYVLKHQGSSEKNFHLEKFDVFQKFLQVFDASFVQPYYLLRRPWSTLRLRRSLFLWSKRGHLRLTKPDWDPVMDLTIHMDISRNPGPGNVAETIKDKSSLS